MATATKQQKKYDFELPLKVSSEKMLEFKHEDLESVYKSISEDINLINGQFQKDKLSFIKVKNVSYQKGHNITFTFEVQTEEELKNFYKASKSKVLSKVLTDYAMSNGFGLMAGLKVEENLKLVMEMGKTEYHKLMTVLCEDVDSEIVPVSGNIKPVIPLPATETWPEKHQQQLTQSSEVKTCSCDFYIFLTKKANMDSIFLSSEYQEFNNFKLTAVPGFEGMWEGHVQIPFEKVKSASYCYVAERAVGYYPLSMVRTYKSQKKFMNSNVQRYEFVPGDHSLHDSYTKEGYLIHCMHILNLNNRLDVLCCIQQIERLSVLSYSFSFDEAVYIMTQLKSEISSHESQTNLIILAVIMMIIVKDILKILKAIQISKDMVKSIMEIFRGTSFVYFSEYCTNHLPHLLQNFCMFYSGKDYNLLHFIYWTYPFLDEQFFIQQIVQHATNQKHFILTDEENFKILQKVIFIIANKVEINAPALGLLERLFRHLPPSLSFRGYKYLCTTCLSSTNEIHNSVKDKLSATLSASFVENISVYASQGKMSELFQMWEIVQDEDVAIKVRDKLQQSLVSFIEKRTDKMLSSELQSLEKMIFNAKLFVDENTHEHLLRVLGQSKIKDLHGLFVTVLWNSKYSDCLIQHPNLLLHWLETALKSHVKDARKEDEICPCYAYLHDALAVPIFPKDGQLKEKLEGIVFKWLSKLDIKQVLRKLDDIEKLNEKKPMFLDLYQKHVLQLLEKQFESSKPEDILLSVCGTRGELRVNSRITSQLVQKMMELYCRPFESDQYENFISMTKISKFWILLVNMEGPLSVNTKKHDVFSKGMICLEFILESLASCSITCNYVEKIAKVHDAKELLTAIGKKSRFDIDKLWKHAVSAVQKEKERMTHVMKVLKEVRTAIPGNRLPAGWENFEEHIKDIDKRLKGGKLSTGYVMDGNQIWSHCLKLPEVSEKLISYIDSQVFWNACLDILSDKPYLAEQNEPIAEEEDIPENEVFEWEKGFRILDSLKYLFCQSDQESDSFTNCVHFLEVLVQYGVLKYREDWTILYKNEEIPMTYVIKMFENADILAEIKLQEKNIQIPIASHRIKALELYHDFDKFQEQVKAIKMALEALEIAPSSDQTFYDAMNAFDKLTCSDIGKITLEQVYKALNTIARIASDLNAERLQVLWALSKARPLINFVKEVADVDFRNLIDAVEEVSEQSVNEATVSGLIDVKRFLQPVLKKDMATGIVQLFQIISDQMKDIKPNELVGKIVDCRDNVHNLRSLYNNVANRGMRTREIINNVIKNGIFSFQVDSSDDCVFSVKYQHGKKQ